MLLSSCCLVDGVVWLSGRLCLVDGVVLLLSGGLLSSCCLVDGVVLVLSGRWCCSLALW